MKPIEFEIEKLKEITFEMFALVKEQMALTKDALLNCDHDLSTEIMRKEKRVNAYELTIDKEVEAFIAMQHPVASDLRFAIAIVKISECLERIGDHAYRISSFVFNDMLTLSDEVKKLIKIEALFDEVDKMLYKVEDALESGDSLVAKSIFKHDKVLDKANDSVHVALIEYGKDHVEELDSLFLLAKISSKLERSGDLITNMAEEVLFYHKSKIVKHKKKSKRIDKELGEKV